MKKLISSSIVRLYSIIQLLPSANTAWFVILNCLILSGCLTDYETTSIEEMTDILVVEGIITDDESTITLSRSMNLTEREYWFPIYVDNANVYVECDDGTQWQSEPYNLNGLYTIKTGQLNLDSRYRLKIEIDNYEYVSDFSYPIKTPEIDSVFWMKRGQGQPVMIHVATHSPDHEVLYYRWSYKEDWEINSDYNLSAYYPYYCWNSANSMDILLGSSKITVFGQLIEKIIEIPPSSKRLSGLYRITLKQNAISKQAYDYFANIKNNTENMGSIFAPVPSELEGNIACITDPGRPVIGYIVISSTTQKIRYISKSDNVYERAPQCEPTLIFGEIPSGYVNVGNGYVFVNCVDCTYWGTTQKPDDWP